MAAKIENTEPVGKEICLTAILRHEDRFLDEWLVYHKLLGIDHFFLYDDGEALSLEQLLKPHGGYVTVIPWYGRQDITEGSNRQLLAYEHSLANYGKDFKWITFIDGDEFIVLKKHKTLRDFLKTIGNAGSVSLNWHVFGHNGFYDDPRGLITAALTRRMKRPSAQLKSISRSKLIQKISRVHLCELKPGSLLVDGNGQKLGNVLYTGIDKVAHINHYQCRSFMNWMSRVDRGDTHLQGADRSHPDESWRTDKDECLRKFVATVALNKNEYPDKYMLKYTYQIMREIITLRRQGTIFQYQASDEYGLQMIVRGQIGEIAKIFLKRAHDPGVSIKGKFERELFLFNYARLTETGDAFYRTITPLLNEIPPLDQSGDAMAYVGGLIRYGAMNIQLGKDCFLRKRNDARLDMAEIDNLLCQCLDQGDFRAADWPISTASFGIYCCLRLDDQSDIKRSTDVERLAKRLDKVLNLLDQETDDMIQLMGYVHLLCEDHIYYGKPWSKHRIMNALSKINACRRHYAAAGEPDADVAAKLAFTLLRAAMLLPEPGLEQAALEMLEKFLKGDEPWANAFSESGLVSLWCSFRELNARAPGERFEAIAYEVYKIAIRRSAGYLNSIDGGNPDAAQLTALSLLGLILVSGADDKRNNSLKQLYTYIT